MHNSVTLQQVFAWECPDCSDVNLLNDGEQLTANRVEDGILDGFGVEDLEPQVVTCKTCGRQFYVERDV